jgi:hypothetical protein
VDGRSGPADTTASAGTRFPGRGSRVTNLPAPPPALVHRRSITDGIIRAFADERPDGPTVCVLTGLVGSGKTTEALRYAREHAGTYDVVWWFRARRPESIEAGLIELGRSLEEDPAAPVGDSAASQLAAVRSQLAAAGRWLLVLDGAPEPDGLLAYLPPSPGHVLITTRQQPRGPLGAKVTVGEMNPDEAERLLAAHLGDEDQATLGDIAETLGHLPLALVAAANYMRTTVTAPADYLRLYERRPDDALRLPGEEDVVAEAFGRELSTIDEKRPQALTVLGVLAFLAPRRVPRVLLADAARRCDDTLGDEIQLNGILGVLGQANLISVGRDDVGCHPTMQHYVRKRLDLGTTEDVLERIRETWEAIPAGPDGSWPPWEELERHLAVFLVHARRENVGVGTTIGIQRRLIRRLLRIDDRPAAQRWTSGLVELSELAGDREDQAKALVLHALALTPGELPYQEHEAWQQARLRQSEAKPGDSAAKVEAALERYARLDDETP